MPTLAVAMATYNGARWLPEQLASIAAQTRLPERLIVSDDGSADATPELVERFARTSPMPVTLLEGPRRGLAENFWHAASQAHEDLIAWADQDDVWHPDKLLRCERALEAGGSDFVSHSAVVVDQRGRPLGGRYPHYRSNARREALTGDPRHVPSGFASLFRRHLLARVDWEARPASHQTYRQMNHDHAVSLVAFACGVRSELRDPLACYRQHDSNSAGDPSARGAEAITLAMRVGAAQFLDLARVMLEQGGFAAAASDRPEQVAGYFERFAARCRRRAAIYERELHAGARASHLGRAALRGDYRARSRGGFGQLALCRDLLELVPRPRRATLATLSPREPK
jgi:Glycosyl transferase family 2